MRSADFSLSLLLCLVCIAFLVQVTVFQVLSSERNNGLCENLEEIIRKRDPPFRNSKEGRQKLAASPPTVRACFLGFGKVEFALS